MVGASDDFLLVGRPLFPSTLTLFFRRLELRRSLQHGHGAVDGRERRDAGRLEEDQA